MKKIPFLLAYLLLSLFTHAQENVRANTNNPLKALLEPVLQNDRQYRLMVDSVEHKYGAQSKQWNDLWKIIQKNDSVNRVIVTALLDKYGWLGADAVGVEGNLAIYAVILHAGMEIQDKYLPVMREAVKNKNATPANLAYLEDKNALKHGKRQLYGSQITTDDSGSFLAPVEDPDNLDKRRAEVGLGPIAQSLQKLQMMWDLEDYKRQLPFLEKRQSEVEYR